jgi:hypothetical protein
MEKTQKRDRFAQVVEGPAQLRWPDETSVHAAATSPWPLELP